MASILEVRMLLIGEEDTLLWLSRGDLQGETGSAIIAAQDQALQTKYPLTNRNRQQMQNV